MAYLARYAHVAPSEFGRLTPARTRVLAEGTRALVDSDWDVTIALARMIALAGTGRS